MARRIFANPQHYFGNSSFDTCKNIHTNLTGPSQLSGVPALAGIMKSSPLPSKTSMGGIRNISETKLPEMRAVPQDEFNQSTTNPQLRQPTSEVSIDIELQTMSTNLTNLTPAAAAYDSLQHLINNLPQMNYDQQQRTIELMNNLTGCFDASTHEYLLDQIERNTKK
jgi:hypothetical protein